MGRVPPKERLETVLGVHIAAGTAYLARVDAGGQVVLDGPDRLVPSKHLTDATQLRDFADRFAQELRRLSTVAVGVVHPRLYSWKYSDAFVRVSLEAAIMLRAAEADVHYACVKQEAAARAVGVPLPKLSSALAAKYGISAPPLWSQRCLAVLAAAAVARGRWND